MGQMDPDLVGAAGLQAAGEQAGDRLAVGAGVALQHLPMGDRRAAAFAHGELVARHAGGGRAAASIVPFGRAGAPQTKAR